MKIGGAIEVASAGQGIDPLAVILALGMVLVLALLVPALVILLLAPFKSRR